MSTTTVPDDAGGWVVPGYVEQRELSHGASGRLVEAVEERTTLQVAIKYLGPDLVTDPDFLPRFRRQMLKLKDLDVPSVVRVYDYAEEPAQVEEPAQSEEPEDPEEPEQSAEPEEPEQPEQPAEPAEPEQSAEPRSLRSPSSPSSPRNPRSPSSPRSRRSPRSSRGTPQ
jgi:hypothetical protein